ncbi:phospholipase [Clostridium niameyense]|uniref:Phospholipase n=1 Tax=Clostridium niameyense TaxID=1622073 RepID=A0A6M0RB08_9CLOT|nr:patatin-like phospholipase family protein [Clostridium niameyense]NEZ47471.1 phospholipase [Clostridium niameyense]
MKANAVFDSGGIKGIGILGSLSYMESKGFQWEKVAGTSVGAIIASLIASGYTSKDLKKMNTNFIDFLDKESSQRSTLVVKALRLFKDKGIYSGDYIENWIEDLLKSKGISTFNDLMNNGECRLKIVTADITRRRMAVFPDDLSRYGLTASTFKISKAVRMSISIPFYFKPVKFIHGDGISYMVDGGISCPYPISIFDKKNSISKIPTIGFKFDNPDISNTRLGKTDPMSFLFDISDTMSFEKRNSWMTKKNLERTILIPTDGINSIDFDISKQETLKLYKSGYKAAEKFYKNFTSNKTLSDNAYEIENYH